MKAKKKEPEPFLPGARERVIRVRHVLHWGPCYEPLTVRAYVKDGLTLDQVVRLDIPATDRAWVICRFLTAAWLTQQLDFNPTRTPDGLRNDTVEKWASLSRRVIRSGVSSLEIEERYWVRLFKQWFPGVRIRVVTERGHQRLYALQEAGRRETRGLRASQSLTSLEERIRARARLGGYPNGDVPQ